MPKHVSDELDLLATLILLEQELGAEVIDIEPADERVYTIA